MPPEPSAPVAPAPAAPTPSPAPAAPAGGDGGGSPSATDAFEKQFDLDQPSGPATPAPAAPSPAPAPPKPGAAPAKPAAAAKPAPAPAKPGAAPSPAPTEFDEVEGVQVPRFKSDKDFRGWGLGGYKKAKQLEADMQALQTKYTELEQLVPRTKAEKEQLATKLATIEKQHNELQEELKYQNYQRSDDYKKNYEKPYHDAIARAHQEIAEFTVTEEDRSQQPDGEGKYPTKERQATPADFDEIYGMKLGPATKLASKKFGPEALATVMGHYNTIRGLAQKALGALNEWKAKGAEREKELATQRVQTAQQVETLWTQVNADIKSKNPDLFDERKDNKEWNENLAKGTAMADAYFADKSQMPLPQRVVFDAQVRNRIAAFPALVGHVRKLEAELAQAQKDIAELRGSGPGAPQVETPTPPAGDSEGAMAEFDKKM